MNSSNDHNMDKENASYLKLLKEYNDLKEEYNKLFHEVQKENWLSILIMKTVCQIDINNLKSLIRKNSIDEYALRSDGLKTNLDEHYDENVLILPSRSLVEPNTEESVDATQEEIVELENMLVEQIVLTEEIINNKYLFDEMLDLSPIKHTKTDENYVRNLAEQDKLEEEENYDKETTDPDDEADISLKKELSLTKSKEIPKLNISRQLRKENNHAPNGNEAIAEIKAEKLLEIENASQIYENNQKRNTIDRDEPICTIKMLKFLGFAFFIYLLALPSLYLISNRL